LVVVSSVAAVVVVLAMAVLVAFAGPPPLPSPQPFDIDPSVILLVPVVGGLSSPAQDFSDHPTIYFPDEGSLALSDEPSALTPEDARTVNDPWRSLRRRTS
jgi:hypothetical protein